MAGFSNYSDITGHFTTRDSSLVTTVDGRISDLAPANGSESTSFINGSANYRPWYSRNDNLEQRQISEDFTDTNYFVHDNVGVVEYAEGYRVTANAGTSDAGLRQVNAGNGSGSRPPGTPGLRMYLRLEVEYVNHQYLNVGDGADSNWHNSVFDLVNGTVDSAGAYTISNKIRRNDDDTRWIIEIVWDNVNVSIGGHNIYVYMVSSGDGDTPASYTWAGTEAYDIFRMQVASDLASKDYLAANGTIQFRGVNGKSIAQYMGGQNLQLAESIATMISVDNGGVLFAFRPDATSSTAVLIADTNLEFRIEIDSDTIYGVNDDGSQDMTAAEDLIAGHVYLARLRHFEGNIYFSLYDGSGWSAETPVASGDTVNSSNTWEMGAWATGGGRGFYGAIGDAIFATDGNEMLGVQKMLIAEYFSPIVGKTEKHFLAKITRKYKEGDFDTATFWVGTKAFAEDALYFGNELILPLLKNVDGFGTDARNVVPSDKRGTITLIDSRGSLAFDKRIRDLQVNATFFRQSIKLYSFEKHPDHYGIEEDLVEEFAGEIIDLAINPGSDEISFEAGSSTLSNKIATKEILADDFPFAPESTLGAHAPLVFGENVPLVPLRISSDGWQNPSWLYAKTFANSFPMRGITKYKVKNDDGRYQEIESTGSDFEIFDQTGTMEGTYHTNTETYVRAFKLDAAPHNTIATFLAFKLRGSTGAPLDAGELVLGLHRLNESTGGPEKEAFMTMRVDTGDYSSEYSTTANFWLDVSLPKPLIVLTTDVLFVSYTSDVSIGGGSQTPRIPKFAGAAKDYWRLTKGTDDTFFENPNNKKCFCKLYGLYITDSVSGVNSYAEFQTNQKNPGTSQTVPDITLLNWLIEADGLEDDSSGTISGVANSILKNPVNALRLLYFQMDYEITGGTLEGLDTTTYDPETIIEDDIKGSTLGAATYSDLIYEIAQSFACKFLPQKQKGLVLWTYGAAEPSAFNFKSEFEVDGINLEVEGQVINQGKFVYNRNTEPLTIEQIQISDQPRNYSNLLKVDRGDSDPFLNDLLTKSQGTYGEREIGEGYSLSNWIGTESAVKRLATYLFSEGAFEKLTIKGNIPFWHNRTLDVGQVGTLTHLALPNAEGTMPEHLTLKPTTAAPIEVSDFDGSGDYYSITDNADLSFANDAFCFQVFARFDDLSSNRTLIGKYTSSGNQREYLAYYDSSGNQIYWTVSYNGTGATTLASETELNFVPEVGVEYGFFFWHDPDADVIGMRVFQPGSGSAGEYATKAHASGCYDGTAVFCIGAYNAGSSANMNGLIGAVACWGRVPSYAEQLRFYNDGRPLSYNELTSEDKVDLIGFWPLDNTEQLCLAAENIGIGGAGWSTVRITPTQDDVANPFNGEIDADLLVPDAGTNTNYYTYRTMPFVSGQAYKFSFFAKREASDSPHIAISLNQAGSYFAYGVAAFDLENGIAGNFSAVSNAAMVAVEGWPGWWLCSFEATATSTATGNSPAFMLMDPDNYSSMWWDAPGGGSGVWVSRLHMRRTSVRDRYISPSGSNYYYVGWDEHTNLLHLTRNGTEAYGDFGSNSDAATREVQENIGNGYPYKRARNLGVRILSKDPIYNVQEGQVQLSLELREL